MPNKMLIDAIHPEETRVVVLRDKKVEDFDFEAASKKPLRGNIYLAKVTRVEPSLQAAFIEYGGNRHGFLAFSEIHPDYYQIPQADRAALLADERASRTDEDDEAPKKSRGGSRRRGAKSDDAGSGGGNSRRQSRSAAKADPAAEPVNEAKADETAPAQLANPSASVAEEAVSSDEAPVSLDRAIAQVEETYEADIDAAVDNPARDVEVTGEGESAYDAPGAAASEESAAVTPSPASDEARAEAAAPTVAAETDAAPGAVTENAAPEAVAEAATPADGEAEPVEEKPKRRRRTTAGTATKAKTGTTTTRKRAPAAKKPTTKKSDDGLADPVVSDDEALREDDRNDHDDDDDSVTSIGEQDALEEIPERRRAAPRRQYKIQDVIRRRQILLVQVVKEERGTKGAALTTYLSLAGRYSVLMPNTDRGGGVSRKITDNADRKRLKSSVAELEVPEGMGIILRTAAASRTKTEIKRDFEYLIRLWESVRDLTLASIAPQLVYEEGNLVKRAIRDLYNKEIDEVLVSGEPAYREAKDFMKMLMPSHAKNVKRYLEPTPIFTKYSVESQLDAMFSEVVTLPSKGYLVINPTEALVSIDVNSGRSTKESNIEDTALKTNLEAADEVARQLRLRDLAGLIVIDFIDMDEKRHNRQVEKRLKDALKLDRSRIQVGRISPFGLLEMSRQRIRQGMVETSMVPCEACGGNGHVRSTQSVALHCLRALEDHLLKHADHNVTIKTSATVALYILNQKRQHLNELEERFGLEIGVDADETLSGQHLAIVPGALVVREPGVEPPTAQIAPDAAIVEHDDEDEIEGEDESTVEAESEAETTEARDASGERSGSRRRRRRRRRGGGADDRRDDESRGNSGDEDGAQVASDGGDAVTGEVEAESDTEDSGAEDTGDGEMQADGDDDRRGRRRRGRRGGRRHRRDEDTAEDGETAEAAPVNETEAAAAPQAPEPAATPDEAPAAEAAAQDAPAEAASANGADTEADAAEEPAAEAAEAPAPEQKSDGARPRRAGWWQRRSFF
ncbi:Rne/Rng family ribonuclease [Acuticoccus sp. I52.16.1]|uniref:Rne/Rng family ribonuclease n=1 Tax=Acuticoccus sp. I52.16.1 TaxID=2928472 RepID=UPI001FD1BE20|nr:Rne/Rng family ribonuclease [Acuticoccus sp. I52.16.1]UOM33075.1 Rne/Rng family ribonuclease [Acuticoccus sp. I52.16.1]